MREDRIVTLWGPQEEDFIKRNYEIMSTSDIADVLGRTKNALSHKMRRMGLKTSNYKAWTASDDEVLRKGILKGMKRSEIASLLNATVGQVNHRVVRLGLYSLPTPAKVEAEGRPRQKITEIRPSVSCERPVYEVLPLEMNPFHMIL